MENIWIISLVLHSTLIQILGSCIFLFKFVRFVLFVVLIVKVKVNVIVDTSVQSV